MRWLKGILGREDPIVKLVAALSEPEALMRRELLEGEGVPAMVRSMAGDSVAYGATPVNAFDLFVKRSDVARAEEILGPLMSPHAETEDAPSEGPGGQGNGHGDGYAR